LNAERPGSGLSGAWPELSRGFHNSLQLEREWTRTDTLWADLQTFTFPEPNCVSGLRPGLVWQRLAVSTVLTTPAPITQPVSTRARVSECFVAIDMSTLSNMTSTGDISTRDLSSMSFVSYIAE